MNKLEEALDGKPVWDLPKSLSDELVDTYGLRPVRWIATWAFLFIMLGGFAGGVVLWIWCEKILSQNAIKAAKTVDGFAYDSNFGIGLLIGLFVWIFLPLPVYGCIVRILPMPYKGTFFLVSRGDNRKKNAVSIPKKPKLDLNPVPHSASELINNYLNKVLGKLLLILSPFVLLTGFITQAELTRFTVLNPVGLNKSDMFSKTLTLHPWQDAEKVELGCNFVAARHGRNAKPESNDIIYEVSWKDGTKVSLNIADQINGRSWVDNFETIDAAISTGDAEFKRWAWLKRDPLHPTCINHFERKLGSSQFTRLSKLLRIGELP